MKKEMINFIKDEKSFEFQAANGKCKSFKNGYDMWKFAIQNDPKMEFKFDEKSGPFLSDFFDRRRKSK